MGAEKRLFLEQDSSAVMVRAVSSALRGEFFSALNIKPPLPLIVRVLSLAGKGAMSAVVSSFACNLGIKLEDTRYIDSETASRWAVSRYPRKRYNSVLVGAPSGGTTHIAALMNAPFLTQHFLVGIKIPKTRPDDVERITSYGLRAARIINSRDKSLDVIVHYDPIHDRFLSGCMGTIRVKLTRLTRAYEDFIRSNLRPEGVIFYMNVGYSWLQHIVDERIHVQIGG